VFKFLKARRSFAAGTVLIVVAGMLACGCKQDIDVERTKLPYIDEKPAPKEKCEKPAQKPAENPAVKKDGI
jgi:hypothetical protein